MKILVRKFAHRAAWIGVAFLLLIVAFRISVLSVMRLVVGAVLVYGAISLAGALVEKVWSTAHSVALIRCVRFPRAAATAVVLLALFLVALLFQIMSDLPGGHVVTAAASGGFLFVGGCLVGGRWLSIVWEVCAEIFRKPSATRGEVQ